MQSIETKYVGATSTRGSRIKATSSSGQSVTVAYNHAYDIDDNHPRRSGRPRAQARVDRQDGFRRRPQRKRQRLRLHAHVARRRHRHRQVEEPSRRSVSPPYPCPSSPRELLEAPMKWNVHIAGESRHHVVHVPEASHGEHRAVEMLAAKHFHVAQHRVLVMPTPKSERSRAEATLHYPAAWKNPMSRTRRDPRLRRLTKVKENVHENLHENVENITINRAPRAAKRKPRRKKRRGGGGQPSLAAYAARMGNVSAATDPRRRRKGKGKRRSRR